MIKKVLILIVVFYLLTLLQTSFLVHFNIKGIIPNLVLITVILLNLFEQPKSYTGLISAFLGGFFLDIFSENFIGFYVLILVGLAISIKFIFKKYVKLSAS